MFLAVSNFSGLFLAGVSWQDFNNANLWYTFASKGYIPFGDFYKILPGGGSPKTAL